MTELAELAHGLSLDGLTYQQVADRFNRDYRHWDGGRRKWTRRCIENLSNHGDPDHGMQLPAKPDPEFKLCPDCAEEVRFAARICRYCRFEFARPAPTLLPEPASRPKAPMNQDEKRESAGPCEPATVSRPTAPNSAAPAAATSPQNEPGHGVANTALALGIYPWVMAVSAIGMRENGEDPSANMLVQVAPIAAAISIVLALGLLAVRYSRSVGTSRRAWIALVISTLWVAGLVAVLAGDGAFSRDSDGIVRDDAYMECIADESKTLAECDSLE